MALIKEVATQVADTYASTIAGRVFAVTGSNTGIGKETARVLVTHGAKTVYMLCRDARKTEDAVKDIVTESPKADVRLVPLDLSSFKSIRAVADALLKDGLPLFALINNAAVAATPEDMKTAEGIDMQFGTNVVGHHLLTQLLLPLLRKGGSPDAPSRVVVVASGAHNLAYMKGIAYDRTVKYESMKAYGQSKLGNVFYARDLQRQFEANNEPIVCVSLHPGVIRTELMRHSAGWFPGAYQLFKAIFMVFRPLQKSIAQGAATSVFCATAPVGKLAKGGYHADCSAFDHIVEPFAKDPTLAKKLYDACDTLLKNPTAIKF